RRGAAGTRRSELEDREHVPILRSLGGHHRPGRRPMRYTDSGPPRFGGGIPYSALEIFWIKVTDLKGEGLQWPPRIFGLVAVRDSMDPRRNILFQRSKDNCQVLTAQDSSMVLTGPSCAIAVIDPPEFEAELRVIGARPSEEKLLCDVYFDYRNRHTGTDVGPKHYTESGPPFGGLHYDALEIFSLKVTEIKEGFEWPLRVFGLVAVRDSMDYKRNILFHRSKENCQILTAEVCVEYMGEEKIVLLNSSDRNATVESDGSIPL
ncbi:hypothetical protein BAE44_0017750, partial [Dichanthelium oligosanthes]